MAGGARKHRHEGAIGAAALASREAYQAGMPPFSFALPAANLPASRAQHQVCLICSGAGRVNPRQHSAGGEIDRRFPLVPPVCAQGFLVMLRYIVRIEVAHIGNTILTYAEKGVYCTYKKAYVRKGGGTCQDHANAGAFALCLAAGALGRWMALWH